jgi:hypothetical protein
VFTCALLSFSRNGSLNWLYLLLFFLFVCRNDDLMCCHSFPVLDFTLQVLRKRNDADDMIFALIVFSVQYIMVNHMNWKYKKYSHWKTTLRVQFYFRFIENMPLFAIQNMHFPYLLLLLKFFSFYLLDLMIVFSTC